jgi:LysR family transcriptional regulator, hydrogen peroxide-inducible genes activator
MNLQQLEYIIAVDRYKSFSKAAAACFVTQATLSTMVRKLEEELDLVIFDRKTSPVITTECGLQLVEEARRGVFHANRLKSLAAEIKGKIEGELHIGIIPTVAANLLPRILPFMLETYPALKLTIQEITTANILQRLRLGEMDAGIVSTPLGEQDMEESILYYEKLMVYGAETAEVDMYRSPQHIPQDKIWLLEKENCLTDQISKICSLNSRQWHRNLHFQPNSFDTLLNLVDQMNGLTLLPELYANDLPADRKTRIRDFSKPYPVREISIIAYRPYAKLRLINALSNHIKDIVQPALQTSTLQNSEMRIARI